jgi:hypothetical protein
MAIQLYPDGMSFRRVAQHLGVNPQSVANWVKAHTETLPAAPVPEKWFMRKWTHYLHSPRIKNGIYLITIVDHKTYCILGWKVVWNTPSSAPAMVDNMQKGNDFDTPLRQTNYVLRNMCYMVKCYSIFSWVTMFTETFYIWL